ncbi:MAG: alpha/beta fold hydrolase [Bacteroidales bacterium]|jgi:dipeptidyl aminopeptidase/acylaminoacyl peptidase|nr:alpha/beta fold hydrolase [Bacteroidales bacterium]
MKKILFVISAILLVSCTGQKVKEVNQYSIAQFYENININFAAFSPDETRILVTSNETGIYNVFEINISDGTKRQITNSETESLFALNYVYGTNQILYSADKGGNENNHIYLLDEDGTTTDLTPGDAVKASFNGFSQDKKVMYLSSNKRDPQFFDLYKMNIGEWKEEIIWENKEGFDYAGATKDREMLALVKSITTSENQLFLLDRLTGQTTEVSEPDKPGTYGASGFTNDKAYFFYTTDVGKEFTYLVKYEIATGAREVIYETNWDVMGGWLSENETYRIIGINEDARIQIKITDQSTGMDIVYPEIPGANINNLSISESEKYLLLSLGTSKTPGDIYLYEFGGKEMKRLTSTMNPDINPDDLVDAQVVRYPSFDGLEIPAIYYKPLMATKKNKVPALVWVHGGPGGQSMMYYNPVIQYLSNHGYAVLAVNNRGSSGYGKSFYKMDDRNHGDKDLKDCIWGKKWLQSQNYIDTAKIGIIGGSYGGFMTMAAMTSAPNEFKVGVNLFGVTNWLRTLKSIPPYWASFRDALYTEMGDPFSADSTRLYEISPLFHGQNVIHPVMVLQGANDPRVLQVESDEMVEAIKANAVTVEYVVFPDEGHGFVKKENEIKAYSRILAFLDTYLKETGEGS